MMMNLNPFNFRIRGHISELSGGKKRMFLSDKIFIIKGELKMNDED